jgi:hypothetical protein
MEEDGRRIRSVAKKKWLGEIMSDPVRLIELSLVALGTVVASLSSFFSWQAASYTAEQARYARDALNAADTNATFRTYIASWNKLCEVVTPPEYKLYVQTPVLMDGTLEVLATNTGFDRALFDIDAHNKRVSNQEAIVRDNLLELRTFVSNDDLFVRPDQALSVTAFFYIINISTEGPEELQTRLVRAAALCNYYTEEQMRWYKDRTRTIAPVVYLLQSMKIEYTENTSPDPLHR